MTQGKRTWSPELSISFSDRETVRTVVTRGHWPSTELKLSAPETDRTLKLVFDDPPDVVIDFVVSAVLDANYGTQSLVRPANWYYYREGVQRERGEGSIIYRPVETGTVALDIVDVDSDSAPEGGRGRFNEAVSLDSKLRINPVPVSAREQLSTLYDFGQKVLEIYREHGGDRSEPQQQLQKIVQDVEGALTSGKDDNRVGFDTSLDRYEELFLENPTTTEDVHGPIQDEWLRTHALETDTIERLVDERIRSADGESARRWYKALFMIEDEITERTLNALAADPDQRAIGGLLLFVWDDDPQFAPQAVSILGSLLAAHETFEEARESYQYVFQQIENLSAQSNHTSVRAAAVEALEKIN
ncbi:hypothetical protein [Natrinema salaciae]|uniref:Uncharacterized protein n=1 Tax=Natrinema salaciae TaxID=1186196 RepID=A0A1H9IRG5_9EURY|nr:hypothetical protein [Natrinema salaciae]SEQ77170.1 hypothetical protein SAMN04489841_2311 [Natrinema salaciae]